MELTLGIGNLGWGEWVVIAFVILIFFGPKRLPELARGLGRALRQFQQGLRDVKDKIDKE